MEGRPTLIKSYVISMSVKAVHLEVVQDLIMEGFLLALKRLCLPTVIYSDNGTSFMEPTTMPFSTSKKSEGNYSQANGNSSLKCTSRGLWKTAIKSMKIHLKKIMGTVKLNYETLPQIEAYLIRRPLAPMATTDGEEVESLTP